uniref:JmjC domain-containing protein n=1 Tax=Chromera velia CCMP2878 TaxID=1169474 RepID=A0A0G4F6T0_9ALVE|eukprot:Cvel_15421.t1-p1 / transcript=Cvel_15421.t1 / gene=Cvel_15421 / organism=Chromera_velia_CCMP2878 / gene_product=Lysine-specific demethylase 4D, putative / transcript_product=Lysine-specific demethylase 4D, putative / location=Cvel_scaffold1139:45119-53238(+) / protein_length=1416 / sequence_SO=supercontig / SO=protein_coding / is_pseudo=false
MSSPMPPSFRAPNRSLADSFVDLCSDLVEGFSQNEKAKAFGGMKICPPSSWVARRDGYAELVEIRLSNVKRQRLFAVPDFEGAFEACNESAGGGPDGFGTVRDLFTKAREEVAEAVQKKAEREEREKVAAAQMEIEKAEREKAAATQIETETEARDKAAPEATKVDHSEKAAEEKGRVFVADSSMGGDKAEGETEKGEGGKVQQAETPQEPTTGGGEENSPDLPEEEGSSAAVQSISSSSASRLIPRSVFATATTVSSFKDADTEGHPNHPPKPMDAVSSIVLNGSLETLPSSAAASVTGCDTHKTESYRFNNAPPEIRGSESESGENQTADSQAHLQQNSSERHHETVDGELSGPQKDQQQQQQQQQQNQESTPEGEYSIPVPAAAASSSSASEDPPARPHGFVPWSPKKHFTRKKVGQPLWLRIAESDECEAENRKESDSRKAKAPQTKKGNGDLDLLRSTEERDEKGGMNVGGRRSDKEEAEKFWSFLPLTAETIQGSSLPPSPSPVACQEREAGEARESKRINAPVSFPPAQSAFPFIAILQHSAPASSSAVLPPPSLSGPTSSAHHQPSAFPSDQPAPVPPPLNPKTSPPPDPPSMPLSESAPLSAGEPLAQAETDKDPIVAKPSPAISLGLVRLSKRKAGDSLLEEVDDESDPPCITEPSRPLHQTGEGDPMDLLEEEGGEDPTETVAETDRPRQRRRLDGTPPTPPIDLNGIGGALPASSGTLEDGGGVSGPSSLEMNRDARGVFETEPHQQEEGMNFSLPFPAPTFAQGAAAASASVWTTKKETAEEEETRAVLSSSLVPSEGNPEGEQKGISVPEEGIAGAATSPVSPSAAPPEQPTAAAAEAEVCVSEGKSEKEGDEKKEEEEESAQAQAQQEEKGRRGLEDDCAPPLPPAPFASMIEGECLVPNPSPQSDSTPLNILPPPASAEGQVQQKEGEERTDANAVHASRVNGGESGSVLPPHDSLPMEAPASSSGVEEEGQKGVLHLFVETNLSGREEQRSAGRETQSESVQKNDEDVPPAPILMSPITYHSAPSSPSTPSEAVSGEWRSVSFEAEDDAEGEEMRSQAAGDAERQFPFAEREGASVAFSLPPLGVQTQSGDGDVAMKTGDEKEEDDLESLPPPPPPVFNEAGVRLPLYGVDEEISLFDDNAPGNLAALGGNKLLRWMGGKEIAGVSTPFVYFGTRFSFFVMHIEDKDLPSVNFLHWGAPKTWYFVARHQKEKLEEFMRRQMPEHFVGCHEYLRHKSLIVRPEVLRAAGISVNTVTQRPGEFIVTLPGCYHFGFNHGNNFAEAVNFSIPSWVSDGARAFTCQCADRPPSVDICMKPIFEEIYGAKAMDTLKELRTEAQKEKNRARDRLRNAYKRKEAQARRERERARRLYLKALREKEMEEEEEEEEEDNWCMGEDLEVE